MSNIDKKTFRRCILFFFILTFIIYGKSIGNDYAMDDEFVIHNNQQVHGGIKAIPNIFRTTYAIGNKASYEYRPLVKATYAIEYQFFGENPHISHFINILLYVLLLSFLFYLLLRILYNYHYLFSFGIALLFLIHPLHSEVIMSIKNRDVMLSFLGCLLSLFFYLRYADNKKIYDILFGSFFLLFAIMSKKDSITFMAVIPFSLWFFKEAGWKKMTIVIFSYLPALFTFRMAASHLTNSKIRTLLEWENPLFQHTTMLHRIPQGFYSLYFYVKMFILPYPLVSYYGFNQVPVVGWDNPVVWIVILLLIVLGYYVVKNFRSKPIWLYGVLYFIITISMFLNVVEPVVGIVGERFAFIPSLGLCIVAVYFILKYLKIPIENTQFRVGSFSNKLWPVAGVIVLLYGGEIFARNAAWKNAYVLYKTDSENAPESAHIHSLLSATAIQKVQTEPRLSREEKHRLVLEAEEHYKEALRIIPNYISAHNNLGMVYYTYMGAPDKAIPELTRAVQLDTNYVEAYFNLASCYAALKQYDQAEKLYKKTIRLDPKFMNSYSSLSNMYAMNREFDKILRLNQRAIDRGIKSDVMYINIGNVYFMNGDTLKALPYLEKAIEFNANNKNLNGFLANYYQTKGNNQKASYYYDLMSRSTPR
ncbi:MAG: tetratricopeptide repeat protein [Bacteroidetes bacterium]|nr:tetratricopeptide repeat protein [Bacteroidota bacterium]